MGATGNLGVPAGRRVVRLTAPNPGLMTGEGTNTYLIGAEDVAVVDVGVADQQHLDRIMRAAEGAIRWILVTHAHADHAPGAFELANMTGACVYGYGAAGLFPSRPFKPQRRLRDTQSIAGSDWQLTAYHTPGHARDHLCFFLEPEGMLFSGDHIMGGSTVVIIPPDGDMARYMTSLARLDKLDLRSIAPGHGDVITDPHAEIARILAHRRAREAAVLGALSARGPLTVGEIVEELYSTVPKALHEWAAHSVYAHLLKLRREGFATGRDRRGNWRCV